MKKQSLAVAGIAAITMLLSGCSILSAIPGLGGPDPRCAVIEKAVADQLDSSGAPEGSFEAFDVAKADLPGSAKLPSATCSYRFTSDTEGTAYFGFYLTKDDAREDAVGAALTSAGFADGGGDGQHLWSSPPADDGSHVIVSLSPIEDAGIDGDEAFLEALGKDGDIITVLFA